MSNEMITTNVDAAANLPRDLAIVKMENDQIFSLAAARPRQMETIRADLADMIQNFPQFADEAIYEKPVGKDENGVMKYARGLSVRAAETLAELYGFNRIHSDIECLSDGRVKVYASFTDYQRGRTWEDSTVVSPFYRARSGAMQRHPEDRFLNVIVKAEKSKLIREVINRSVNQALKAWFENECEKQMAKTLDDATVQKILDGFKAFGMGLEQVESIVGRAKALGWTSQDRIRLTGVYNALKSGETTVAEILDGEPKKSGVSTVASGTVDGLLNPSGAAVENHHRKPDQEAKEPKNEMKQPQSPPEESQEPLIDVLLRNVKAAKKLADVNFIEGRATDLNEEDRAELVRACLERREQIKSTRGKLPETT